MRVLEIHCSSFSYGVKRDTPVSEEPRTEDLKDVLVCFTCFEKKDEGRSHELVGKFAESIKVCAAFRAIAPLMESWTKDEKIKPPFDPTELAISIENTSLKLL